MKKVFIIILVLGMQSLLFWSCEDPSLEKIVVKEAEKAAFQFTEEPQKVICYFGGPQPGFPGGAKELFKFLASNINYPAQQVQDGVEGTIYIAFYIDIDGTLSDFQVKRGVHPVLDAEALRVLKLMPNWVWFPNKEADIPEKILFTMPVKFKLTK